MNQINRTNEALFEELVERIQEKSEAAGIAVAIVNAAGETEYEKYFGYRDKEQKLPIDGDTIFGLASVTKSFVALSVMQLCERGLVELDAPVSRYVPEFTNKNQAPVLVRHFLSHSGGFYPVHRTTVREVCEKLGIDAEKSGDLAFDRGFAEAGAQLVAKQLDAQTKEHGLIGRPGEYMSYCNDGYGLLSEIVRRVGGEDSFAAYVKANILKPLGMERSGADYLRPQRDPNASLLYKKRNGIMETGWDYYDNAFVLGGAGAMKSTLSDMKRYAAMYLNYGRIPGGDERILSMEGIRAMTRPVIGYRPDSFYCFGLAVKKLDDLTVTEHGGSLTGVSSNLSWSWDVGAGVIVLCNTSDVPVSVIADAAMRMYHGRAPVENRDLYREYGWTDERERAACGVYESGEGNQVEIFLENGDPCAKINGRRVRFVTVQENLGLARGAERDAAIQLFPDADGGIFAVGYGGRMLPRVAENSMKKE